MIERVATAVDGERSVGRWMASASQPNSQHATMNLNQRLQNGGYREHMGVEPTDDTV